MGRKALKLSKNELVELENMAAIGMTQQEISDVKGISVDTLRKYAQAELKRGKSKMLAQVKRKAFELALAGDRTLLIFILKTQAGWREVAPIPEAILRLLNPQEEEEDDGN